MASGNIRERCFLPLRSSQRDIRILVAMLGFGFAAAAAAGQEPLERLFDLPSNWLQSETETNEGEEAEEPLETDRDSFTPATTVVGRGRVLAEASYSFIDGRRGETTHSYPELLTRIGLSRNLEFRIGWNYEIGGGGSVSGADVLPGAEGGVAETEREGGLLYGLKAALTEQDEWLPQSALIVQATTPTSGPDPATQFNTGYVWGWTLPNKWLLDAALRYGIDSDKHDHFNTWSPSVVLKVPLHERINVHAEYFGTFTQHKADDRAAQYFSPGIHYLVTPDCEIGVRVGWGLTQDAANFFSNVGLGVRF